MEIEGGGAGDKQSSSAKKGLSSSTKNKSNALLSTEAQSQSQPSDTKKASSSPSPITNPTAHHILESFESQQQHSSSGHQVIAVSASKGPAAFFNLARKFLATDEFCDLSALEGAIVSAVDAAHLLERSKLADIVRIQTSYVPVEPKRKPQEPLKETGISASATGIVPHGFQPEEQQHTSKKTHVGKKGAPLRRSRIIITVKRTDEYKRWLEDNPYQATGHNEDIENSPT